MPDLAPGGSLPVVGTKSRSGLQDGCWQSSAQLPWDLHGAAVLEEKHRRGPRSHWGGHGEKMEGIIVRKDNDLFMAVIRKL